MRGLDAKKRLLGNKARFVWTVSVVDRGESIRGRKEGKTAIVRFSF